jgi:hypothetical protein
MVQRSSGMTRCGVPSSDGNGHPFEPGGLEDNPRQLGNGRVRLAGSAPPKLRRKTRGRRQDSPVPPAAFARRRYANQGPRGEAR